MASTKQLLCRILQKINAKQCVMCRFDAKYCEKETPIYQFCSIDKVGTLDATATERDHVNLVETRVPVTR